MADKEYRINFRVSKEFKERFLSFLKDHSMKITDFCIDAISEKMRKIGGYNNNAVIKKIKEMSQKLNGVAKDQKTTMKRQAEKLEKTSEFETYKKINEKVIVIKDILELHKEKESYRTNKYKGYILGCLTSEIIEKAKLPRNEVWDILKNLETSGQITKCKNGGWNLNE